MRSRALSALTTIVIVALGLAGMALTGLSGSGVPAPAVDEALRTDIVSARNEAAAFLAEYVAGDGRVVRHDQGGDTVSEGQAYAMTVAAAIGDEARFRRVWAWTRTELLRDDGLFAWHWSDGQVVDDTPAADADLLIAAALVLGGDRFDDPSLTTAGRAVGRAVLAHETVELGDGRRALVAGPWARPSRTVNPSYLVVPAMSRLWWRGEHAWAEVAATSRELLDALTAGSPHLPPDWATATEDGGRLSGVPIGDPPAYGWDAMRVAVQQAADCDPEGRAIAARMWGFHLAQGVAAGRVYSLDGRPIDDGTHAAALVATAGAASAAGAPDSVRVLLARAEWWDAERPTYYGGAWLALGRLWLTTDLLGGCAGS